MFSFLFRRTFLFIALFFASGDLVGKLTAPYVIGSGLDVSGGANPASTGGFIGRHEGLMLAAAVSLIVLVAAVLAMRANRIVGWSFVFAAFAALGCLRLWQEREAVLYAPLAKLVTSESPGEFGGRVVGFPRLGGTYARILVAVDRVGDARFRRPVGNMMLFWKAGGDRDITCGDWISFIAAADVPEPPRNPGEFDWREYLLSRGACVEAFAMGDTWVRRVGKRGVLAKAYSAARQKLFSALAQNQPSPAKEILISLIYGDKTTDIDPKVEEEFRRAGLTHILVVSGTQVSLIIFFLIGVLSPREDDFSARGAISRVGAGAAVIGAVFFYSVITGFETSVVRALLMGVLFLFARLFMRETDGLSELARASIIILAFQPGQLFGASFQLSFTACAGLIYVYGILGPRLIRGRRGAVSYLLLTLITTGGAQLFVAPVLAAHFNQFSAWGLPANLIAIPLAALILFVGIVYNIAGLLGIVFFGKLPAFILSMMLFALIDTAKIFAGLPGSNIIVATPSPVFIALIYIAILTSGEIIRQLWLPGALHKEEAAKPQYNANAPPLRVFQRPGFSVKAASAILALSVCAILYLSLFSHPARPRLVVLAAKNGGACILVDRGGACAAVIAPAGTTSARKNAARLLVSALRYYGIDRPDTLFVLADPGEEAAAELAALDASKVYGYWSGGSTASAPGIGGASGVPGGAAGVAAGIQDGAVWNGADAAIGVSASGQGASGVASAAITGREIIYLPYDVSASDLKALFEGRPAPRAIIATGDVLDRAARILNRDGHNEAGEVLFVSLDGAGGPGAVPALSVANGAIEIEASGDNGLSVSTAK